MKSTPAEVRQRFRQKGLKLTPQRYAIYEMMLHTDSHPTVEDIYQAVQPMFPMLSLNTVYYTLTSLKKAGLIADVPVQEGAARFDANMDRHHHLVCLKCRKIEDLYDDALDQLKISTKSTNGYLVESHRVEFRGYCSECRTPRRRSTQKVR
ncbi:MAG TPA: transcriptional repressor [Nitrospirales bacterium]|jgi:Fur family peroxide stress response transcriptional regulator